MSAETKLAGVVRALAEAMALSPELIAESPADYVHQLKQQLAAARAARNVVARDYQAAARGEEAARQQLAEADDLGRVYSGHRLAAAARQIESGKVTP